MLEIEEQGTVAERIIKLVNHFCQGNKTAFGRAANIQSGVLAGIVGGRESKPGFEILQKLLTAYPTINPNWLLFGRGDMLVESSTPTVEQTHPHLMGPNGTAVIGGLTISIDKEGRRKQWEQYYEDRARFERTSSVLKALGEYLAKTDSSPELRGILNMLPDVLNPPIDPDTEDMIWDAKHEDEIEQNHRDEEAEWARQRQEREQQQGQ
jgi:hypothetical protein